MRSPLTFGAMLVLLASCAPSTPPRAGPSVDPALEAQAKSGDVVGACTLVANDLRQCEAYRNLWLLNGGTKPQCLADAVPRAHEGYLSDAVGGMPKGAQRDSGEAIVRDVALIQTLYRVDDGDDPAAIKLIDTIVETCPLLAPL